MTIQGTVSVVRRPAVAGYYYPADSETLAREVDALIGRQPRAEVIAVVVPHGSIQRAGRIAGTTLGGVAIPPRVILLGPSHTNTPIGWSLMTSGAYRTPLGDVPVDERLAESLRARCPFLEPDPHAQRGEHAVEVLLPFLQRLGPAELSLVPIIMAREAGDELEALAEALAEVIRQQPSPVLLAASADLSSFGPTEAVRLADGRLIDAITSLDAARLFREAAASDLPMCGYGAVSCVLRAAKRLGAAGGRLVQYATSAEASGDPHSATGYGGVLLA